MKTVTVNIKGTPQSFSVKEAMQLRRDLKEQIYKRTREAWMRRHTGEQAAIIAEYFDNSRRKPPITSA